MKTLKYKLYKNKKYNRLNKDINLAANIYNHCIALHKRYYRLFKKHLNRFALQKHITKLKALSKYAHWKNLNSQSIQEITERIDKGYQLFFEKLKSKHGKISPPGFRKKFKYRSIIFKQTGFKYLGSNKIKIGKHIYKFSLSRPIVGRIKTMSLKRDVLGDFYICFSVEVEEEQVQAASDKIVGFDFGLSVFLTASDCNDIESPRFMHQEIGKVKKTGHIFSKKKKGSNNKKRARKNLARQHLYIANKRRDWFFKTAHGLCKKYKLISFETLNIKAMAKLWGRKVLDLAFPEFISTLEHVSKRYKTILHFCDQFFPSSKTCYLCDYYNGDLVLKQTQWTCAGCHAILDRNRNASFNLLRAGASAHGLGDIRPSLAAVSVRIQESHRL